MFRYVFTAPWYYQRKLRKPGIYYGYFEGFEQNIKNKEGRRSREFIGSGLPK
jgi:hypothetical protein